MRNLKFTTLAVERALDAATPRLDRRAFLFGAAAGLGALGLSGCATDGMSAAEAQKLYGPLPQEKFPVPAVDVGKLDSKYYRRTVPYDSNEAAGTIVVDPSKYYVYRIEGDGNATAMAPMSGAPDSCGAGRPMSDASPNGRSGRRLRR